MPVSNEVYKHDPRFCAICTGEGAGWSGYRPHDLTDDCWCTKGFFGKHCELAEKWGLTEV
jgi:hypothetical protein